MKPIVLFVVPLPPPFAGVEVVSQTIVNQAIHAPYEAIVIKSNVRDSNSRKGRWDFQGISRVIGICIRLISRLLSRRPSVVYLIISQNLSGLVRDAAYILICRLFRVRVIGHYHGANISNFLRAQPVFSRRIFVWALNRLDKMIVLSNSIRFSLFPFMPEEKLFLIYNGISTNFLARRAENPTVDLTIIFMGHLSRAKGFADILDAAENILSDNHHLVFKFAGERLIREKNIDLPTSDVEMWSKFDRLKEQFPGRIVLTGILSGEEKTRFFSDADIFILPSYSEAFPISVLEAMAAQLPLIVTPVGVLPDILKDQQSCLFVQPGDIDGIKKAILTLVSNRELRHDLGLAGKKLSAQFSSERMCDQVNTLIGEVLNADAEK